LVKEIIWINSKRTNVSITKTVEEVATHPLKPVYIATVIIKLIMLSKRLSLLVKARKRR